MAARKPLVLINGNVEELSSSDTSTGLPQAAPAGANTNVQYHDLNGSGQSIMGGDANFVWDKTNKNLSISTQSDGLRVNNNKVWNAGNDGAGSGLDADTVDSLHATSFVRADADTTVNGYNLTYSDTSNSTKGIVTARKQVSTTTVEAQGSASSAPSGGGVIAMGSSAGTADLTFHNNSGTKTGFVQTDPSNTRIIIGQEQNNAKLIFRNQSGGSAVDNEVIHAGNHTTIVNAEGNALALAIALG